MSDPHYDAGAVVAYAGVPPRFAVARRRRHDQGWEAGDTFDAATLGLVEEGQAERALEEGRAFRVEADHHGHRSGPAHLIR